MGENIAAIERGDMSQDDWNSLVLMAHTWRGRLVVQETVDTESTQEQTHELDGVFAGLEEFRTFAITTHGDRRSGTDAFTGALKTAFMQRSGTGELQEFPRILFRKEPPDHENIGAALRRRDDPNLAIDLGSLATFLAAFQNSSEQLSGDRLKNHMQKLPKTLREIGRTFCEELISRELRQREFDNQT